MALWKRKLNNQGSTLLTVIICIALIGILGSLMLSVAMTNLQMKIVETQAKDNFYTCEMAMEEIRVGIQELAAGKIQEVYESKVLSDYSTFFSEGIDDAQRNILIQNAVVVELMRILGDADGISDTNLINISDIPPKSQDMFNSFLTDVVDSTRSLFIGNLSSNGISVLIKDITVGLERNEYKTAITSDIRINIPEFSFTEGTHYESISMEQPFKKYAIVAERGLQSHNFNYNSKIIGSVYAGNQGILVKGDNNASYELIIEGENIVTRGNITVSDTAKLTIGTLASKPIIWADNLITETTIHYPSNSLLPTIMDLNALCVIKDDLSIDGRNSQVNINSGAYLGYTGQLTSKGSAMMLNGPGSSLNLSGLSKLVLAGRAHVFVENEDLGRNANILTGESLALKSNQRAYLLPGKFITDIDHNPVTEEDIARIGVPVINIMEPTDASEIDYRGYVAELPTANPYKIAAKQTGLAGMGLASTLRYYYINFRSGKLADEFFALYHQKYPTVINALSPFHAGTVSLPTSGLVFTAGNLTAYNGSEVLLTPGMSSNSTYLNDTDLNTAISAISMEDSVFTGTPLLHKTIGSLEGMYSRMTHLLTLDLTGRTYQEGDLPVESHIIPNGIQYVAGSVLNLWNDDIEFIKHQGVIELNNNDESKQFFAVIDGNVTIRNKFNGFLMASGNITLETGAQINGIIITSGETGNGNINVLNGVDVKGRLIAAGDILLGANCNIEMNDDVEEAIATIFRTEGNVLHYLIRNTQRYLSITSTMPAANLVDLSNMISYENWRKNE